MWRIAGSNPIALKGSANFETRQHQCDSPEEFRPSKPTRYSLSRVPITDCVRHMESAYIVCGHEASPCLSYQQHTYTIIAIFDGLMTFLQLHSTLPFTSSTCVRPLEIPRISCDTPLCTIVPFKLTDLTNSSCCFSSCVLKSRSGYQTTSLYYLVYVLGLHTLQSFCPLSNQGPRACLRRGGRHSSTTKPSLLPIS